MRRLDRRLRQAPPVLATGIAVGVATGGLVGAPLDGGLQWAFAHPVSARPSIAGNVVVGAGGHELFCLDVTNGRQLWTRPIGGLLLLGAGDDGRTTVATLESVSGQGNTLLAVSRDGTVVRQLETTERLGQPAVVGGVTFVPWGERMISAYDLIGGDEIAGVSLEMPTSHAFVDGRTLFFAGEGVVRFDAQFIETVGRNAEATVRLPEHDILGAPRWVPPVALLSSPVAGYADRVRAYARATPEGQPLAVLDDTYYTIFYRIVFGVHAPDAAMRWLHSHSSSDVVGAAALPGGVAICDEAGHVTLLDGTTGAVRGDHAFGRSLASCVVQAGAFALSPSIAQAPPLTSQLAAVLTMPGAELLPAQRVALARLSVERTVAATEALRAAAADPRTPLPLISEIARALATRPSQ